jgi:hypothetical protein
MMHHPDLARIARAKRTGAFIPRTTPQPVAHSQATPPAPQPAGQGDSDLHQLHRRNDRRATWAQLGIIALYAVALTAAAAFAHMTDRAAQGVTDCRALKYAQCPDFLK